MIELLLDTLQLLLKGKLFRDPAQVFVRLGLCNLAAAALVIAASGARAAPWLLLLLVATLGLLVPYTLRHVKYR